MKIEITSKFSKQLGSCTNTRVKGKVAYIIGLVINSNSLVNIQNVKKLKGTKNYYSIRIGSYRIGIVKEGECVIFAAFDKRSDIYKYFP